jgi:hypothetical protein
MGKKIKLVPDPQFKASVPVPVAGAGTVDTEFTFKHRTREEMRAFIKRVNVPHGEEGEMTDVELVMECACGWELVDTFNEVNVKEFCAQYIGGPTAVFETYVAEMAGARLKNSVRPRL